MFSFLKKKDKIQEETSWIDFSDEGRIPFAVQQTQKIVALIGGTPVLRDEDDEVHVRGSWDGNKTRCVTSTLFGGSEFEMKLRTSLKNFDGVVIWGEEGAESENEKVADWDSEWDVVEEKHFLRDDIYIEGEKEDLETQKAFLETISHEVDSILSILETGGCFGIFDDRVSIDLSAEELLSSQSNVIIEERLQLLSRLVNTLHNR